MEIFLKILTIIGSLLGTIAFIQNITREVVYVNKEKWKKIISIITPLDFDNLQYVAEARRMNGKLIDKLERLMHAIDKNDADIIGFKGFIRKKINVKLKELRQLYRDLRQYIQVPFWNPYDDESANGGSYGYVFDKSVFFKELNPEGTHMVPVDGTVKYVEHLENVGNIALQMEKAFAEVQRLAGKESYELLMFWRA